jgi:uncharacterized protein YbaP (TraB family)
MLPEMEAKDPGVRQRIDAAASRIANGNAVLWRVSRDGVKPSYLFGTIHLSDERVTNLPPMVVAKLEAANRVALEVADVSPQAFMSALGQIQDRLVFKDGRNLTTLLDPADLATAQSALATVGFPATVRPQLRPWFVTMMLAVTSCERTRLQAGRQPLDLKIGEMARRRGVPVLGLETIRDQLLVMAGVPEADQIKVLQATLKSYARMGDALEAMLQRYLAREMHKVLPMQAEMLRAQGFDPAIMNSFQHALLTVRNPRMRDAALPILAEGEAFIAVGALHLIGETGLVALLRQSGYELTPAD